MVNANAKTPNKKRKSMPNVEASPEQSPKKTKMNESLKTPGKNKNNATPGNAKTPKAGQEQKTPKKTPKPTPAKNQETPKPTAKNQEQSAQKSNKKEKKTSESESEGGSPKKMKMFTGTSNLDEAKVKKGQKGEKKEKRPRRTPFDSIKQKLRAGDKSVIEAIEEKLKNFQNRKEISKTAKRKMRILQKLKREALGEKAAVPVTPTQKRRERKKKTKAKHEAAEGKEDKPVKGKQQKQTKKAAAVKKEEEEEESSDEAETEITPGKILKTKEQSEEESGEEEEESGEEESGDEEEESGEEEEEGEDDDEEDSDEEDESEEEEVENKGKKSKQVHTPDLKSLEENKIVNKKQKRYVLFVGNLPYDADKKEISEHFKKAGEIRHIRIPTDKTTNKPRGFAYVEFNDEIAYQKGLSLHHTFVKGRRINVLYTTGGKKKGEVKKNEVKAKNLKLQAMRKQGQLAGSVKENQKRSARRNKKNAVKVNGS